MEIKLTFQERLKDLRTERGLTLSELETATGISRSSLGKYESDECKEVSHASIVTLAKYYDVTSDYLLGLSENKNPANADLSDLHLQDDVIAILKSGKLNNRLLCELIRHDRFRRFLTDNGFTVPVSASYTKVSDALDDFSRFRLPVIVKPVDSAGSKGVRRVDNEADLPAAVANALAHSISGQFIIEEFIEAKGFASDTECFTVNGELQFVSFNNQYFDALAENPYTPAGFTWPSHMPQTCQDELRSELQRLMTLLSMKNSVYNIECRQGTDGKAYLMEVSPRGGGNRLCEMLHYACGTNLIRSAVCAALGEPLDPLSDPVYDGFWAQVILHSDRDGLFKCLSIDDSVRGNVVEEALWVQPGEAIERFTGANKSLGTLVLRFDSAEEADARMSSIRDWLKIETK